MSQPRKIYTISVGWYEVRNVAIVAASADEAMDKAQKDWGLDRNLNWRDCPSFEPPLFQIEDEEVLGTPLDDAKDVETDSVPATPAKASSDE